MWLFYAIRFLEKNHFNSFHQFRSYQSFKFSLLLVLIFPFFEIFWKLLWFKNYSMYYFEMNKYLLIIMHEFWQFTQYVILFKLSAFEASIYVLNLIQKQRWVFETLRKNQFTIFFFFFSQEPFSTYLYVSTYIILHRFFFFGFFMMISICR